MMLLYLRWKAGDRTVINDIVVLALENGCSIMSNDDLFQYRVLGSQEHRPLVSDEMECGLILQGMYYVVVGDAVAKNNLLLIETAVRGLLEKAQAKEVCAKITRTLPC